MFNEELVRCIPNKVLTDEEVQRLVEKEKERCRMQQAGQTMVDAGTQSSMSVRVTEALQNLHL